MGGVWRLVSVLVLGSTVACGGGGASGGGGDRDAAADGGRTGEDGATAQHRQVDTSVFLTTSTLRASENMGVVANGLSGLLLEPLRASSLEGVVANGLSSETLADSGKTMGQVNREVLAYVYSCALPPESRMEVEIDGESWLFEGEVGLAPEWEQGSCDEACQEWVSACVLARTNAFDKPVFISMRGDHPALEVPAKVAETYTLREGSYYGNLFTGEIAGNAYACAGGRGGAIPELTDRFCAVIGDDCPIETVADCNINEFACDVDFPACSSRTACSAWDERGHPTTCYSRAHPCGEAPSGTAYSRVITVYIRPPQAECGNGICEQGEAGACADCDGHWARRFGSGCHEDAGGLALDDAGNAAVTGRFFGEIDFGSGSHSTGAGDPDTDLFVAKLDAAGDAVWSRALDAGGEQTMARAVATDAAGDVLVAGHFSGTSDFGGGPVTPDGFSFFIAKYDGSTGAPVWSRTLIGDQPLFPTSLGQLPHPAIAADESGGVLLATDFVGTLDLGLSGNQNPSAADERDILVARFDASGELDWHRTLSGAGDERVKALALDGSGGAALGGSFEREIDFAGASFSAGGAGEWDAFVVALSASGETRWARQIGGPSQLDDVRDLSVGRDDRVAVVGIFRDTLDVAGAATLSSSVDGGGAPTVDAFVATFDSSGSPGWARSYGGGRSDFGSVVSWDGSGSFVAGYRIASEEGETVDVEGTAVDSGVYGDIVLVRYRADGHALSVTQRGSPVTEVPRGLVASPGGELSLTGEFMGTLRFGGTYLTNAGGSWEDQRPADLFVTRIDVLP